MPEHEDITGVGNLHESKAAVYNASGTEIISADGTTWKSPFAIVIACSDETSDLTTGEKVRFRAPFAMTVTDVKGSVTTAPTGANIIVDIHDSGTTIMTTNKIVIEATETTSEDATTQPTLTDTTIAADAIITIEIDQIGSSTAGAGLKVEIIGRRA